MRRIPLIATLLVLVAIGIMIRLGLWQLDRMHQKEELLSHYSAAEGLSADVPFPQDEAAAERFLYRHATVDCREVTSRTSVAGSNAHGEPGLAHVAQCNLADGGKARIVLGWARDPATPEWQGGVVQGLIAPGPRLVADPPVAGLEANGRPDPADLPNNHLSYAVQWFLFAATALVIYVLALRKRLAVKGEHR